MQTHYAKWLLIGIICWCALSGQAAATSKAKQPPKPKKATPYLRVAVEESYTDNVYLRPTKTSDELTVVSLWYRQPVAEIADNPLRVTLDTKAYHWANSSFDDYVYAAIGADYRIQQGTGDSVRVVARHTINDSYDDAAPFTLFHANEAGVLWTGKIQKGLTAEAEYLFSDRHWPSTESGRDGSAHDVTARATWRLRPEWDIDGLVHWQKVITSDPNEAYTRYWLGAGLTRYFGVKRSGMQLSLDYRYSGKTYDNTTREDRKNSATLGMMLPLAHQNQVDVRYTAANNRSTIATRAYTQQVLSLSVAHRF